MRLYIDNQYPPRLVDILTQINNLEVIPPYEIIYRTWNDNYNKEDTIVFLVNFNKKAIDQNIVSHYEDGFRVFVFRKPYEEEFSIYQQALLFLSHWRKILDAITSETQPFIYSIGSRNLKKLA